MEGRWCRRLGRERAGEERSRCTGCCWVSPFPSRVRSGAAGSSQTLLSFALFYRSSSTGIVNLYSTSSSSSSDLYSSNPASFSSQATYQPPTQLKAFTNLTTPISHLAFNPDGQILAAVSKEKKDALKLVRLRLFRVSTRPVLSSPVSSLLLSDSMHHSQYHTPSGTTFQNWPTASTPLGHVTSLGWSPRSDVLAMGNHKGKVLLYRLRDYAAY